MGKTKSTAKAASQKRGTRSSDYGHRLRSNMGKTKSTSVGTPVGRPCKTRVTGHDTSKHRNAISHYGRKGSKLELQKELLWESKDAVSHKRTNDVPSNKERNKTDVGKKKTKKGVAPPEETDFSPECIWDVDPSSLDVEPQGFTKTPSKRPGKGTGTPSETPFNTGKEAIIHDSPTITVVDLSSDFKSGSSQTVSLIPKEGSGGKRKKKVKKHPQTGSSPGLEYQGFTVPQMNITKAKMNPNIPTTETSPMQSVYVVDLASKLNTVANTSTASDQNPDCLKDSSKKKKRKLSESHNRAKSPDNSKQQEELFCEDDAKQKQEGGRTQTKRTSTSKKKKRKSSVESVVKLVDPSGCADDKEVASPSLPRETAKVTTKKGKKVSIESPAQNAGQSIEDNVAEQIAATQSNSAPDRIEERMESDQMQTAKSATGTAAHMEMMENGEESVDVSGSSSVSPVDGIEAEEASLMEVSEEDLGARGTISCHSEVTNKPSYRILKLQNSDQCLVLLPHPGKFSFHGRVLVRAVHGTVTILGFPLSAGDGDNRFYPVYSPNSSCALCLETPMGSASEEDLVEPSSDETTLVESLEAFLEVEGELETAGDLLGLGEGYDVALSFKKMPADRPVEYVERFPGYSKLFNSPDGKQFAEQDEASSYNVAAASAIGFQPTTPITPGTLFDTLPGYHTVTQAVRSWLHAMDAMPVVLVCGWKNSGKSTLCRYLTNALLPSAGSLCYLECDMAQTEFTPPGLLSLQLVKQPLLGPPFTHLREPERMCFYGDVNVRGDPDSYLQMVHHLCQLYRSRHRDRPLIINTMGWMQGLGFQLLIDIIQMTQPTHIVQLWSRNQPRIVQRLTPELLEQTAGWWHRPQEGNGGNRAGTMSPVVLEIDVPFVNDQGGSKVKAQDHRTMALLAGLSDLQPSALPFAPVALSSLTPRVLPWRCVAVHVTNGHVPARQVMYALNGSVVGLCRSDPAQMMSLAEDLPRVLNSTPVCECFGLGIIRGIDPVQKVFYILTGVSQDALHKVNTLLKGSLTLPQPLLTQGHRVADVPYVSRDFSSVIIGSGAIKVRRNIKQRGR